MIDPAPPASVPAGSSLTASQFREHLQWHGEIWIEAWGHSMAPAIHPGDRVLVRSGGKVRYGDVILVSSPGRLVLHRVIAWMWTSKGLRYLTKGDATRKADGWCEAAQILGRADLLVPTAGGTQCGEHLPFWKNWLWAATSWQSASWRQWLKRLGIK